MKMNLQLVVCLFVHMYSVSGCVDLTSVKQDGKKMISNVFKMVDSVSLYTCASYCLTVSMCKSVSYQRETRACHLASQDSAGDPGDVHTDPEFFLTEISLWPGSLAGPCEGVTCTSGNRCVVDRLNVPSCVTEEGLGCGPAPDLTNAMKSSPGQYEGAVTQYTCLSDFLFCGTSSTHTCSSLGNWEGLSGACNRAIWYNPTLKFEEPAPCPMTTDYHIVVEAIPLLPRRMVVALKTSVDVQLQMDIRINHVGISNETWLNRRINNVWHHEIIADMPFVVSQPFVADIRRQNSNYEVFIDGAFYGAVPDITPDENPDMVVLDADMQVTKYEFARV